MSREKKWTPGPWVSGWNGGKTGPTCPSAEGVTCGDSKYLPVGYGTETVAIVVMQDVNTASRFGSLEANANLVAAAPDLVDALERAALVLGGEANTKRALIAALDAARTALAKAYGEQQ